MRRYRGLSWVFLLLSIVDAVIGRVDLAGIDLVLSVGFQILADVREVRDEARAHAAVIAAAIELSR